MANESTFTSPLIAASEPSRASSPNYNSTDRASLDVNHDGADGADLSTADHSNKTTPTQAFVTLLKGYIGPGCLSLPWAVSQLGLVGGTISIGAMCYWSSHNCWTVVKIKRYIEKSQADSKSQAGSGDLDEKSEGASSQASQAAMTYPDVGGWAFGDAFKDLVAAMICTQQLAICTVFFSFIGENILAVAQLVPDVPVILLSHSGVMTVALPFILGLSYIPNVRKLAPVMVLGLILLFSGFGVLAYIVFAEWPYRPTEPLEIRWINLPLAVCAILYSYEGICLVLPVESSMKDPRKFKKVFWLAMIASGIVFAAVATLCTRAFGDVTSGSITAFLLGKFKDDETIMLFLMLANTFVSLSVLFTYPIQLFPTLELIGPNVQKLLRDHDKPAEDTLTENTEETDDGGIPGDSYFVRTGLVIVTYTIAMIVPNVQVLISLAGAVAGSSNALLIPPVLELALIDHLENKPDETASTKSTPDPQQPATQTSAFRHVLRCNFEGVYWKQKLESFILFWMGFIFMLIGSYASLADIVKIWLGNDE